MKRALTVTALLAMGFLMASSFAAAQDKPASTAGGEVTIGLLGRSDVASSKFEEYREVPKGVSLPFLNLFATSSKFDFNLLAKNVRQSDQRYTGWFNTSVIDIGFDYNQIPHNMGNDGKTIWMENSPGVWGMNTAVRSYLANAADPVASASRVYSFYQPLVAPLYADTNTVNISSQRERGTVEFDLGKKLPFDLAMTYMREAKSGYRGRGGGNLLGWVGEIVELPEPLDEITQDYGFRGAYNFKTNSALKMGNVHGTFNRNTFNNRTETMTIDNPFRPTDVAYTASTAPNGGAMGFFTTAPDNAATTGGLGFQLQFAKMTRLAFDWAAASWTNDSPFYPYTLNTTVLNGSGVPANTVGSLQQASLNGKIDTKTINFYASSRPIDGLGIRLQYRSYGYKDKSARYVITGDTAAVPDVRWQSAPAATEEDPFGRATANRTDSETSTFNVQASYDIKALTLEGAYRKAHSTWVGRVDSSGDEGDEKTYTVAVLYHASDLLGIRFMNDWANRTVKGYSTDPLDPSQAFTQGVMYDHAKRDQMRTGFQIDLTPVSKVGLTFTYFRRNVEFPDRPSKAANDSTAFSGLLSAKYDSFTGEVDFNPSAKMELSAYYTYEKDAAENQAVTLTSGNLNSKINYLGTDKTDTFGVNFAYHIVPDKWTFRLLARSQKVNGLLDITANETGSFYTGRSTLIPPGQGGAADIPEWDDTTLTTFGLQLEYAIGKAWKFAGGYAYEKYDFGDIVTSGTVYTPLESTRVDFFMKANNGAYKANVAYTTLTYRF
jgi:hypothetical protein